MRLCALVFTLVFFAATAITLPSDKYAQHASFVRVFGKERMQAHFPTASHFEAAVKQTRELHHAALQRSSQHAHKEDHAVQLQHAVACTENSRGRAARELLTGSLLGSGVLAPSSAGVHTAYSSRKANAACFLLAGTAQQLDATQRDAAVTAFGFSTWTPVPPALKAHHSAMDAIVAPASATAAATPAGQLALAGSSDPPLSRLQLLVTMGVGSATAHPAGSAAALVLRVQGSLVAGAGAAGVLRRVQTATAGHRGRRGGVWGASANFLSAGASCSFGQLSFNTGGEFDLGTMQQRASGSTSGSVTVTNLHSMAAAGADANVHGHCLAALVAAFVSDGAVADVRVTPLPVAFNAEGKAIAEANAAYNSGLSAAQNFPYQDDGLDGTGIVVGVADTGLDDLSCYFINGDGTQTPRSTASNPQTYSTRRKVVQYVTFNDGMDEPAGHGTHVCGTVAGNNINNGADIQNGHASSAKLAFFDIGDSNGNLITPQQYSAMFDIAATAGAKLHSDSWGIGANLYTSSTVDADEYMFDNDQFLALFAAGNDGSTGYYSLGTPAVSKNMVAVGAGMTSSNSVIGAMAYFSSIGPTFDGRIKPDITAAGFPVISALSSTSGTAQTCSTTSKSGTSMATPGAAGNAAMIRQYFEDASYWASICNTAYANCAGGAFSPRGATVKAVLIHSGEPMATYSTSSYNAFTEEPSTALSGANYTPNVYAGFGRVYLGNVLSLTTPAAVPLDLFVDEVVLPELTARSYTVTVTDNTFTHPLKATLVWMDPANTVVSGHMLLHDVDLTISNSSHTFYGNNNPAGDDDNNVEQVTIRNAAAGTYTVTVTSHAFSESSSMKVSVVITSGGSVSTSVSTSSVTEASASDPMNCVGGGGVMLTVRMTDFYSNGWGSNNLYKIRDSSGSVVRGGSQTSVAPNDFELFESFCVPTSDTYDVDLTLSGSGVDGIGLEIAQCGVYLSSLQTAGTLVIGSDGSCNVCSGYELQLQLWGDVDAEEVFGWEPPTAYQLLEGSNLTVVMQGRLTGGVLEDRVLCIDTDGDYTLRFDAGASANAGGDSYELGVGGDSCGMSGDQFSALYPQVFVATDQQATFTVSGSSCTGGSISDYDGTVSSDDDDEGDTLLGTIIGVVVTIAFFGSIAWCCWCACCKPKQSPPAQQGQVLTPAAGAPGQPQYRVVQGQQPGAGSGAQPQYHAVQGQVGAGPAGGAPVIVYIAQQPGQAHLPPHTQLQTRSTQPPPYQQQQAPVQASAEYARPPEVASVVTSSSAAPHDTKGSREVEMQTRPAGNDWWEEELRKRQQYNVENDS